MYTTLESMQGQLVGPADTDFYITKFRDSTYTRPTTHIHFQEPCLSKDELEELDLISNTVTSIFGIYVHKPTKLLIIHCMNKGSFAIRNSDDEIQEVVNRSERNGQLQSLIEGEHYTNFADEYAEFFDAEEDNISQVDVSPGPNESISNDDEEDNEYAQSQTHSRTSSYSSQVLSQGLSQLQESDSSQEDSQGLSTVTSNDIRQELKQVSSFLDSEIPIEASREDLGNSLNYPIPLLPIYLGYRKVYSPEAKIYPIDFSQKDYMNVISENIGNIVLFQKIYTYVDSYVVTINPHIIQDGQEIEFPDINTALKYLLDHPENTTNVDLIQQIVTYYKRFTEIKGTNEDTIETGSADHTDFETENKKSGASSLTLEDYLRVIESEDEDDDEEIRLIDQNDKLGGIKQSEKEHNSNEIDKDKDKKTKSGGLFTLEDYLRIIELEDEEEEDDDDDDDDDHNLLIRLGPSNKTGSIKSLEGQDEHNKNGYNHKVEDKSQETTKTTGLASDYYIVDSSSDDDDSDVDRDKAPRKIIKKELIDSEFPQQRYIYVKRHPLDDRNFKKGSLNSDNDFSVDVSSDESESESGEFSTSQKLKIKRLLNDGVAHESKCTVVSGKSVNITSKINNNHNFKKSYSKASGVEIIDDIQALDPKDKEGSEEDSEVSITDLLQEEAEIFAIRNANISPKKVSDTEGKVEAATQDKEVATQNSINQYGNVLVPATPSTPSQTLPESPKPPLQKQADSPSQLISSGSFPNSQSNESSMKKRELTESNLLSLKRMSDELESSDSEKSYHNPQTTKSDSIFEIPIKVPTRTVLLKKRKIVSSSDNSSKNILSEDENKSSSDIQPDLMDRPRKPNLGPKNLSKREKILKMISKGL